MPPQPNNTHRMTHAKWHMPNDTAKRQWHDTAERSHSPLHSRMKQPNAATANATANATHQRHSQTTQPNDTAEWQQHNTAKSSHSQRHSQCRTPMTQPNDIAKRHMPNDTRQTTHAKQHTPNAATAEWHSQMIHTTAKRRNSQWHS